MASLKKSSFTEEQIAFALRWPEGGIQVREICRKMGVSEQTFYRWKKKFAGMGVAEVHRLKQLEEQNRKLIQLVSGLRLDKHILQDALKGKPLSENVSLFVVGRWRRKRSRRTA